MFNTCDDLYIQDSLMQRTTVFGGQLGPIDRRLQYMCYDSSVQTMSRYDSWGDADDQGTLQAVCE